MNCPFLRYPGFRPDNEELARAGWRCLCAGASSRSASGKLSDRYPSY